MLTQQPPVEIVKPKPLYQAYSLEVLPPKATIMAIQ